jgi:hypothetical protein
MSLKFELDNGKLKEYPTWWILGTEGDSRQDKLCHTKCGLSFKEEQKDSACDHLDCAIDAARTEGLFPLELSCAFFFMWIAFGWYEKGDLLAAIRQMEGTFITCVLLSVPISVFCFKHWLELREYKNHGTIHGRMAHRQ